MTARRMAPAGDTTVGRSRAQQLWAGPPAWPTGVTILLPMAALAVVALLDALQAARRWPIPVVGLLDEPAHLLTAALFLAALLPRRGRALLPWALAGSVLIDLDHIPLYLEPAVVAADGGRPVTHSLLTVLVLVTVAVVVPRWRTALAGLALGLALHFLRDLAWGPGVPLLWPWASTGYRLPYADYLGAVAAATAVATVRCRRARRAAVSDRVP